MGGVEVGGSVKTLSVCGGGNISKRGQKTFDNSDEKSELKRMRGKKKLATLSTKACQTVTVFVWILLIQFQVLF